MAAKKKNNKGNPAWVKGMKSPNPVGRRKGIKDRRSLISQKLLDATGEIADQVIAAAKEGDMQAANIVFARVLPALSAQSEKVQFDLDPTAPLTTQVEQVLTAIADGKVSVDVGKLIIEAINALSSIRQVEELEARIDRLEAVA